VSCIGKHKRRQSIQQQTKKSNWIFSDMLSLSLYHLGVSNCGDSAQHPGTTFSFLRFFILRLRHPEDRVSKYCKTGQLTLHGRNQSGWTIKSCFIRKITLRLTTPRILSRFSLGCLFDRRHNSGHSLAQSRLSLIGKLPLVWVDPTGFPPTSTRTMQVPNPNPNPNSTQRNNK
jgi:hypothetical protein